jgi:hypothetical protein
MLKRADILRVVNDAEIIYASCWDFLASMKSGKLLDNDRVSIIKFQFNLATSIHNLSIYYQKLAKEKNGRIQNKANLSSKWFRMRMRFIDSQQTIILYAILIGKSLGDGFAWFFYQNNRQFLLEHIKQPEQVLLPLGIGGAAEIEVAKRVVISDRYFVLYHGNTSILRLGDFSLIDLKTFKVVSVGEIKSGKASDSKITVSLIFPANDSLDIQGSIRDIENVQHIQSISSVAGASPKARDRLVRQMQRISLSQSSLNQEIHNKASIEMNNQLDKFDKFIGSIKAGGHSYERFGKGLLLIGFDTNRSSLYDKLEKGKVRNLNRKISNIGKKALDLMVPGRLDNSLYVGSWFYRRDGKMPHLPGMTHPIWWPISLETIRRIIFQEVYVATVLNPAHLFSELERLGYKAQVENEEMLYVKKYSDKGRIELQGLKYYLGAIQDYFFAEEDIARFIAEVEAKASNFDLSESTRIDLIIEQRF